MKKLRTIALTMAVLAGVSSIHPAQAQAALTFPEAYPALSEYATGTEKCQALNTMFPGTRSQGVYSGCWAFSSMGAAEFNAVKKGYADPSIDLSETQTIYNLMKASKDPLGLMNDSRRLTWDGSFDIQGANLDAAFRAMAQSSSFMTEKKLPYEKMERVFTSKAKRNFLSGTSNLRLKDCGIVPLEKSLDRNKKIIKKMITKYGAACINVDSVDQFEYIRYLKGGASYYVPKTKDYDHAVMIIGWDDHYGRGKFSKRAPGNGAWLVRNSWNINGTDFNFHDYFWLSYYDHSYRNHVYTDNACYVEVTNENLGDRIYQYDGGCGGGYEVAYPKVANSFVAQQDETLRSVMIESSGAGTLMIYGGDVTKKDPTRGTLLGMQKLSKHWGVGYHNVALKNPIQLKAGERFTVVVAGEPGVTIESSYDYLQTSNNVNFKERVKSKPGESYYCTAWVDEKGRQWQDTADSKMGNLRIKACTGADTVTESSLEQVQRKQQEGIATYLPPTPKVSAGYQKERSRNSAKLTWKQDETAKEYSLTCYNVCRKIKGEKAKTIGKATVDETGTVTYYDDKIPTAKGKKVTYWIRAVAGKQTSEKSGDVTVTVK